MDAMAMALHIVYYTLNYKEAVFKAANVGGDADTVAAIVGQIAGALYGITPAMLELYKSVQCFDHNGFALRAYKLFHQHFL